MPAVLLDWDGTILRSEIAKALGWILAALRVLGVVDESLFIRLHDPTQGGDAAREALGFVKEKYSAALEELCGLAGRSRQDTRREVWRLLLAGTTSAADSALDGYRNSVKDALILRLSEPNTGTIGFIQALHGHVGLGLVTQAASKDVTTQAEFHAIPLELFDVVECAGDEFYSSMGDGLDRKAVAYAVACARLGAKPGDAIAFEDTDSGLESACATGLTCIAIREPSNWQSLRLAKLVAPDLGELVSPGLIDLIAAGQPGDAVVAKLRAVLGRPVVGSVLGGSRLRTSWVLPGGELPAPLDVKWRMHVAGDPEELVRFLARQVKKVATDSFVDVAVSTKGPLTKDGGNALLGPCTTLPFPKNWPFEERLRAALGNAGVRFGHTCVILDSVAALKGEMQPRGSLAGQPSGAIMIWGAGIGLAICENGELLREIGQDEEGDARLRVYTSLGRHNVLTPSGYEYRGIPRGESRAPLAAGESWMSERLAGAWLPRIVGRNLLLLDRDARQEVMRTMGVEHVDLQRYVESKERGEEMEGKVLGGLTRAAMTCAWARAELSSIGSEMGNALAAFVWAFHREYEALKHLVLVSTIAERLGAGVADPRGGDDLLMGRLREAMIESLVARGMEHEVAAEFAGGVRRSSVSWERELFAFDPARTRLC